VVVNHIFPRRRVRGLNWALGCLVIAIRFGDEGARATMLTILAFAAEVLLLVWCLAPHRTWMVRKLRCVANNRAVVLCSIVVAHPLVGGFALCACSWVWTQCTYWHEYFVLQHTLHMRKQRIIRESSKRTQRVLNCLDDDQITADELELIEARRYVRCAVVMSRRARMGLKYPKYSPANEKVACDWIGRHLPDGMPLSVKHRVLPLAIKLTFVRSHHEVRAEHHFTWLQDLVDKA